jgi:pimeloyl-ACP methyl ester carboxylesterase
MIGSDDISRADRNVEPCQDSPATSSLQANGLTIALESFGAVDAEPFLLISGLGVQMTRWSVAFCNALASQGYRVIRFDNRDVGLSTHLDTAPIPDFGALAAVLGRGERPDLPYTLGDMALDAVGLLDALQIERAHVVGRSMGGMIAQIMASEHPDRVLSLTSIMSSTGNPGLAGPSPEAMATLTRRGPDPHHDQAGYLDHRVAAARLIASPGFPFDEEAQRVQASAEFGRSYNPPGFARQIAAVGAAGDRRARLRAIAAPTLVIHGAQDLLFPLAGGQDTAANISGAELLVIEGMGHDMPAGLNDTFIRTITANAQRFSLSTLGPRA